MEVYQAKKIITHTKWKKQQNENFWTEEKIFTNYISDKSLYPKYISNLKYSKQKIPNNLI